MKAPAFPFPLLRGLNIELFGAGLRLFLRRSARGGLMAALAAVLFSFAASAATPYTWNPTSGTDWFTAANWTPNGVPSTSDSAIINGGTVTQNSDVTVRS